VWIGVDVGGKRKGFDVAAIDGHRVLSLTSRMQCSQVADLVRRTAPALVAIDSPRSCAPGGHTARDSELELARAICGIRWTPDEEQVRANRYYGWIVEGLALYEALTACAVDLIEVFPTASWTRWCGERGHRTRAAWTQHGLAALHLGDVPTRTNQDQRDAIAAAVTARQHTQGMTETIGEIVVPAVGARRPIRTTISGISAEGT
jgi:predicted nuclease with RNAse H fold